LGYHLNSQSSVAVHSTAPCVFLFGEGAGAREEEAEEKAVLTNNAIEGFGTLADP
jgi:hypothetical protein